MRYSLRNEATSSMPSAVTTRMAPNATLGSSAISPEKNTRNSSRPPAATNCATWVLPPAASTMALRDWLADTGNP
jgi:hypothetical protein